MPPYAQPTFASMASETVARYESADSGSRLLCKIRAEKSVLAQVLAELLEDRGELLFAQQALLAD